MTDNPIADLELEKRIIAAPITTINDAHGQERWELITSIIYTPVMFYDRDMMFLSMIYDKLIMNGTVITPMSVQALAGCTDWRDLLKNCQRLRAMKDLGFQSDHRRQLMMHEPWKVIKDMSGDSVLDSVGGVLFLADAVQYQINSNKDIKAGAKRIRELWEKRQQINIFKDAQAEAEKPDSIRGDVAIKTITAVQELENTFSPTRFTGSLMTEYMEAEDYRRPICGQWPIEIVNQCMPFKGGLVYVIGALQGRGKTSAGVSVALESAKWKEMPEGGILFLSLEMTAKEILMLMMAQTVQKPLTDIENKNLSKSETAHLQTMTDYFNERKQILINDKIHSSDGLITTIRLHAVKHELKLVIIDHLQIVKKNHARMDILEHLGGLTQELKSLAKELNISILELSQLNRKTHDSKHKKDNSAGGDLEPRISDVKGSGTIESDADCMVLLWRSGESAPEGEGDIAMQWILGKNRTGPTKSIPITFHAATGQRFSYRDIGGDEYDV